MCCKCFLSVPEYELLQQKVNTETEELNNFLSFTYCWENTYYCSYYLNSDGKLKHIYL